MNRRNGSFLSGSNYLSSFFSEDTELSAIDDRIDSIRDQLLLSKKPRRLNIRETELLVELLEGWSFKESWDAIIEWSSLAICHGCTFKYAATVYRFWIEALYRSHNFNSLFSLCRHLLSFRHETSEFLSLSLYGLSLIGKRSYARPIAKHLMKLPRKSVLAAESISKFKLEFLSRKRRVEALLTLEKICARPDAHYFSYMNWFESSLENNNHEQAAKAINAMARVFPFAPEPLRTAAHLAMDSLDWPEVVRIFRMLVRLNCNNEEYTLGLAGALEHSGELFEARNLLKKSATKFSVDDYDFSATLGHVSYKLYMKYKEESFRTEAIRAFANCLRVAPQHKIATANFHMFLYELKAGVGEQVSSDARKDQKRRFWLCMADDYGWKRGLPRESFLLKLPPEATRGDILFMCRGKQLQGLPSCNIYGLLEVLTPPVPDEYLERVVKCGNFKMFEEPVAYNFEPEPIMTHDGHGLYNFSAKVGLYFAEFSEEAAEKVVSQVESLGKSFLEKRVRTYA